MVLYYAVVLKHIVLFFVHDDLCNSTLIQSAWYVSAFLTQMLFFKFISDSVTSLCVHSFTFITEHTHTLRDQENRTIYALCAWWKYRYSHCQNLNSMQEIKWCDSQLKPQTRFKIKLLPMQYSHSNVSIKTVICQTYVHSTLFKYVSCFYFIHTCLTVDVKTKYLIVLVNSYKMEVQGRVHVFSYIWLSLKRKSLFLYYSFTLLFLFFLDNEDQILKDKGCVVSGVFVSVPCGVALY